MTRTTRIFILTLLGLLSLQHPLAAQQVVVVGPDLEPKTTSLDAVSLSDDGLLRLRINSGPIKPLNNKQYVAKMVDGQVFVGTLLGAGKDGESIRLAFGYEQRTVVLPLDDLLSFALVGHRVKGDANDDTLLLATGETLVGFVEAIGEKNIAFVVGDADDPIEIPMGRVRGFTIANKPKPVKVEQGLARVLLRDGSSVYLRKAKLKRATQKVAAGVQGTFVAEPETLPITLPMAYVQLIEPLSASFTLQGLNDVPMTTLEGGEVFGVAMPPRVMADGALRLHAPITLGFDLPKGASRLAFTVAMDLDDTIPESRRQMAGCDLMVYEGDRLLAKHSLLPDGPAKRLNLPLASGGLRIVLEPGVNGPVLDRVIITQAELLVSE